MFVNPLPSPSNNEADIEPLILTEPLNVEPLSIDFTTNPLSGDTEAVTLPLFISVETSASIASCESAVNGISNKSAPLPLNTEPLITLIPPLTNNEPLKVEPLITESTMNPLSTSTDAVTLPVDILPASKDKIASTASCAAGVNAAKGMLNKFSPLPLNDEPLFISTPPLINNEPVNV